MRNWPVLLALTAMSLCPQEASKGVVECAVVDANSGAGVSGAPFHLLLNEKERRAGQTDGHETFRVEGLSAGTWQLSIRSAEHMPALRPVVVPPNPNAPVRVQVELIPLGQVSGRVLNGVGEPLKGFPVGMRRLWDVQWIQTTTSGEDGRYRFPKLEPGPYVLDVLPNFRISHTDPAKNSKPVAGPESEEGQQTVWASTYYPGVLERTSAGKLAVRPGVSLEGIDVRVKTAPVRRLSGIVLDEAGKPAANAMVMLSVVNGGDGGMTATDREGRFQFEGVRDGDRRAVAQFRAAGGQTLKVYGDVRIAQRDVTDLELRLAAPFVVKGFVEREEPRDAEGNRKVTAVYLIPENGVWDVQTEAFHRQDGSLELKNVYPARYRILPVGFVPGYYVASVLYGDRDVTTHPVDFTYPPLPIKVVYKAGAGRVNGTVDRGEGLRVVLVPQDEALLQSSQFIRTARCGANGRFTVENLRPGGYYAFAFDRIQPEMLEDVEFVRRIAGKAQRVEVRAGEPATVELRPETWPD